MLVLTPIFPSFNIPKNETCTYSRLITGSVTKLQNACVNNNLSQLQHPKKLNMLLFTTHHRIGNKTSECLCQQQSFPALKSKKINMLLFMTHQGSVIKHQNACVNTNLSQLQHPKKLNMLLFTTHQGSVIKLQNACVNTNLSQL